MRKSDIRDILATLKPRQIATLYRTPKLHLQLYKSWFCSYRLMCNGKYVDHRMDWIVDDEKIADALYEYVCVVKLNRLIEHD